MFQILFAKLKVFLVLFTIFLHAFIKKLDLTNTKCDKRVSSKLQLRWHSSKKFNFCCSRRVLMFQSDKNFLTTHFCIHSLKNPSETLFAMINLIKNQRNVASERLSPQTLKNFKIGWNSKWDWHKLGVFCMSKVVSEHL